MNLKKRTTLFLLITFLTLLTGWIGFKIPGVELQHSPKATSKKTMLSLSPNLESVSNDILNKASGTTSSVLRVEKIKGVCWEAGDSIGMVHIESLKDYSVNWIAQIPFGWQQNHDSPEIAFHNNRGYWGERDIGLTHTGALARQKSVKTLLKPHIWLTRPNGKWRSDIEMDSRAKWQQWFDQYEAFILHHALLAEKNGFEALCIGTELYLPAIKQEQRWRDIIANIRKVYSGQLTYAANFYKEYEEIRFWDALDFIGIQAYFPLSKKDAPSLNELEKGWTPYFRKLKKLHQKWNKPIVFTELGYRSSKDAAIRPWEWEQRGDIPKDLISHKTQAYCYEAFFQTFWKEDWMAGVFLWKWTPENYGQPFDYRKRKRPPSPISFTPKPEGLKVIREWYARK